MARKKSESKADADIVEECHRIFGLCVDRESSPSRLWKEDLRFANGDPDNGYQWEEGRRKQREHEKRPCLTINKVKQHNRQITNDARQNKPSVRVYPVDDGADKKTAEIFNGIIRHIEANSDADTAYDTACEFAVDAGLGYWRVTTGYSSDDSFDQDIFIEAVRNPLNVYLYGYTKVDGSDATHGFVFEDMPKKDYEGRYPDCEPVGWSNTENTDWLNEEKIRVCEYFRVVEEKDTLIAGPDGETKLLSEIKEADPELAKAIMADETYKKRKVAKKLVKWYLIAGKQINDRRDWLGKYIPIVRVIGEEVEIDGKIDRKGHTRAMKDAQRMYNYWTSAAVEFVALQGKQPYIAPAEAITGLESFWDGLNSRNDPYLPYNSVDANGNPIPAPQRQQPPVMAQAYVQGMGIASEEMKMASGQYDASIGAKSNETSGVAITARQRQGDNATFHFTDNKARSICFTGKILVDLIPKVYDTPRIVRMLGEDGSDEMVKIDPGQKASLTEERDQLAGQVRKIFNPNVGRFDVTVAVGPSYNTKRQEAFAALNEMAARNPQLLQVAGDLIMKAADFPMADQLAERMEKTLPPGLKDDDEQNGPSPEVVQLQEQLKQFSEALTNAAAEVDKLEAAQNDKAADIEVRRVSANTGAYEAVTRRLVALGPLLNPAEVKTLADETQREAMAQPDPGMDPSPTMGIPEPTPEQMPPDTAMQQTQQPPREAVF
ncbi:portal protein [Polaromonas sp. YR568]|uniref:portal protein n=1 Tax=Polaromonas sp. YR568 TaxID=1855301 RepID=UPI0031377D3A